MALIHAELVGETSVTEGTGPYSLDGAITAENLRTFVAGVGNANSCEYMSRMGADFERGIGTVTDGSPDSLARTLTLESSNGGAAVNWGVGTKTIICDPAASRYGAISRLVSGTVSAAATLDIVLSGYTSYRALKFVLTNFIPVTDNVTFHLLFSTDGGSTFIATSYAWAAQGVRGVNPLADGSASDTKIVLHASSEGVSNVAGEGGWSGEITLYDPSLATYTRCAFNVDYLSDAAVHNVYFGGGLQPIAQNTDATRFQFSSGNIASGNYAVYGLI